jgi:hypothetical protein
LLGNGTDNTAALLVVCSNTAGTADGQIAFTWVVFAATASGPQVIGTLTPQEPSTILAEHVPYFDNRHGISIRPGSVTVKELWYGPADATCCPSGQATTTWPYNAGRFSRPATVITRDTAPIPAFGDASRWPTLRGHSARGLLVGLDPQTNQAEFVINCGPGLPVNAQIGVPGVMIVNLTGLSFEEDTDPRNPASGSVKTVSLLQWEHDAGHDGWAGYLYLDRKPPVVSDGPGSFGCNNGKVTAGPAA